MEEEEKLELCHKLLRYSVSLLQYNRAIRLPEILPSLVLLVQVCKGAITMPPCIQSM